MHRLNYYFIMRHLLFEGLTKPEVEKLLPCFNATYETFERGQTIFHQGDTVTRMGLILKGSVRLEHVDAWGNIAILGIAKDGKSFGETFACAPEKTILFDIIADTDLEVLFLDVEKIRTPCIKGCPAHAKAARNLGSLIALRYLGLSRRAIATAPRSIRERVLTFLSFQSAEAGSRTFDIPFNRTQLAEYLGVNRTALATELSKMRDEGLIDYDRKTFRLLQ